MKSRTPTQILNVSALIAAVSCSLGIVIAKVPPSELRNYLLLLGGMLWFLFLATYPIALLQYGAVPNTIGTFGSYREFSPARFWSAFIVTMILWTGLVAFIFLYSYMAWHPVA